MLVFFSICKTKRHIHSHSNPLTPTFYNQHPSLITMKFEIQSRKQRILAYSIGVFLLLAAICIPVGVIFATRRGRESEQDHSVAEPMKEALPQESKPIAQVTEEPLNGTSSQESSTVGSASEHEKGTAGNKQTGTVDEKKEPKVEPPYTPGNKAPGNRSEIAGKARSNKILAIAGTVAAGVVVACIAASCFPDQAQQTAQAIGDAYCSLPVSC